jgi:hypothetical protein
MKLKVIAFVAALAASMGISHAQGVFGFGIELDGTGAAATNSGTVTLYALDQDGGSRLLPIEPANTGSNSSAVLNSSWTGASTPATPTFNLGTFVYGVNTLTLEGGSMLTFKNSSSGQDVTSATLNYQIYAVGSGPGATFTAVGLPFNQDNVPGAGSNPGDQRWALESMSTNLLAGLNPGTYVIDVYGSSANTAGGSFASNGGSNFAAEFTVVPEPSTYAMMFGGLGVLVVLQRLRRKSVA